MCIFIILTIFIDVHFLSTPVPTALHLAFKALRLHKRPHGNQATPTDTLLHLSAVTSNALQTCVTDVLQDHSDSVESELHQLGLLLACDWLLELRIALWEGDGGKEEGVGREITPGFYQDLDTLAKLVSLLPSALPRVRLFFNTLCVVKYYSWDIVCVCS